MPEIWETLTSTAETDAPTPVEEVFNCPQCGNEYDTEVTAEECCWPQCPICNERHEHEVDADHCCQSACRECGELWEYESDAEHCCMYQCESCGDWHDYDNERDDCCRSRGGDPYYPVLSTVQPYLLKIPELDERPRRLLSIEQELTGGGAAVAKMLYDHDLSTYDEVTDYSHQPDPRGIAVCEDGSLPSDGGEVKYSRFDLSRATDMQIMSLALTKIRQLHKDAGIVAVGPAAGMHIHMAAKDVHGTVLGPMQMTALHELFCHGEDMIYGLAAAGWPRHRYTGSSNSYAKPIPKVAGQKTPWKVAQVMGSKYYGINFERLLGTVHQCHCGSVRFGSWSECECGAFDLSLIHI